MPAILRETFITASASEFDFGFQSNTPKPNEDPFANLIKIPEPAKVANPFAMGFSTQVPPDSFNSMLPSTPAQIAPMQM